jgi:hypothetical protein
MRPTVTLELDLENVMSLDDDPSATFPDDRLSRTTVYVVREVEVFGDGWGMQTTVTALTMRGGNGGLEVRRA